MGTSPSTSGFAALAPAFPRQATSGQTLGPNQVAFSSRQSYPDNQQVGTWDAAKKGMGIGALLSIPYGLGFAAFMHFGVHRDPEAKKFFDCKECSQRRGGKPASVALGIVTSLLTSALTWVFSGGFIGAISASVTNRKRQDAPTDSAPSPQKAFAWGAGGCLLLNSAIQGLSVAGLFGEKIKKQYRLYWQKPKLGLPLFLLGVAGSAGCGYIASRVTSWVDRRQSR